MCVNPQAKGLCHLGAYLLVGLVFWQCCFWLLILLPTLCYWIILFRNSIFQCSSTSKLYHLYFFWENNILRLHNPHGCNECWCFRGWENGTQAITDTVSKMNRHGIFSLLNCILGFPLGQGRSKYQSSTYHY